MGARRGDSRRTQSQDVEGGEAWCECTTVSKSDRPQNRNAERRSVRGSRGQWCVRNTTDIPNCLSTNTLPFREFPCMPRHSACLNTIHDMKRRELVGNFRDTAFFWLAPPMYP